MKQNIIRSNNIKGITIPAFIHNSNYYYSNLQVYEDGVIECWELTDLGLFRKKMESGWVKPVVPENEDISIFHLGDFKIKDAKWKFDKESFYDYIISCIINMNPEMKNLHQYVEKKGKWQRAKGVYMKEKSDSSDMIIGSNSSFFYFDGNKYFLVNLIIYSDSTIEIQNLPETIVTDYDTVGLYIRRETSNRNSGKLES